MKKIIYLLLFLCLSNSPTQLNGNYFSNLVYEFIFPGNSKNVLPCEPRTAAIAMGTYVIIGSFALWLAEKRNKRIKKQIRENHRLKIMVEKV